MGIKVYWKVIGMIMKTRRAWWWAWLIILKVLKVASLQCLYNVSKKKLWIEFMDHRFWMKARHLQSIRKRKFVKFLQYTKKKYHNCFCVLLWSKTFRLFMEFQSCLLLLVFANIPTVPILPEQSWFLVCCPSVLDWINLSWFLYLLQKDFIYT